MNTAGLIIARSRSQLGGITREQLIALGLSAAQIRTHARSGLLDPVHAGVYRVGPVAAPRSRLLLALWACRGTAVGLFSAAELSDLPAGEGDGLVHVIVPPGKRRGRRPGIHAHRMALAPDEMIVCDGIPATTPARTLLDLAAVVSSRTLEQCLAHAEREKLVTSAQLFALLARHGVRPGTARLRRLLETEPALTRSPAEEKMLALIRRAGLPAPLVNFWLCGAQADFYWKAEGLVVEVDSWEHHGGKAAFLNDRRRDARMAAEGIQVLRVSWHQITKEPEKTAVQIGMALARARVRL